MVISNYIKCSVCDKTYRIRVGIGFDTYQRHFFDCINCEQPIGFAIKATSADDIKTEVVENCSLIRPETPDHIVVNFHPNCAFDKDEIHDPFSFSSMKNMSLIQDHMRYSDKKFQDVATQFDIPNAANLWGIIKNVIRLELSSSKKEKALRQLNIYNEQRNKTNFYTDVNATTSSEALSDFFDAIFYPKINDIFIPIKEDIDQMHADNKLGDFLSHYKIHMQKEHLDRYMAIFTDYFKYRDHFGQLVTNARVGSEDVEDKIVGSKNLDDIKLYYGQAYEALTSNFVILACLNNLSTGRSFDMFQSMTLNKYIKDVEKAKKHNPFQNVVLYKYFHEDLDSSLRNGSHHASIWRDGEIIKFKSGGTGAEREISYSKYLHLCNKLTICLAALWMIEMHLQTKYS